MVMRLCSQASVSSAGNKHKSTKTPVMDMHASAGASCNGTQTRFLSQRWRPKAVLEKENPLICQLHGLIGFGKTKAKAGITIKADTILPGQRSGDILRILKIQQIQKLFLDLMKKVSSQTKLLTRRPIQPLTKHMVEIPTVLIRQILPFPSVMTTALEGQISQLQQQHMLLTIRPHQIWTLLGILWKADMVIMTPGQALLDHWRAQRLLYGPRRRLRMLLLAQHMMLRRAMTLRTITIRPLWGH
jgi:hypothetical protein